MSALTPMLTWLGADACADHLLLQSTDRCAFLAEYRVGQGRVPGSREWLLWQFKCCPSVASSDPRKGWLKQRALETWALWLREAVRREEAERWTWVPIPPSRRRADPDFDDRLSRTLERAFAGYAVDQRALLEQRISTQRDHCSSRRLSEQALYGALALDIAALRRRPLRQGIMLFDDILTSGKHFRCCAQRLREHLPGIPVRGLFLMRRRPARASRSLGLACY